MAVTSTPMADESTAGQLRLQILGPMRLWRDDVELDPGPRQQAALLAMLLARADQPISQAELIKLIWDDGPPASALNVIHKYVGALRRVLEPGLSTRATGSYLQRRGDGYLFASRGSRLDLVAFRDLVGQTRAGVAAGHDQLALDLMVTALALWQGSAGDGLSHGLTAVPLFVGLNQEFLGACLTATDLAVRLEQPERVLPALRLASALAPLDEQIQAALVTSLSRAGHRTEALVVLDTVRARLDEDLGIGPGTALRAAEQLVIAQCQAPRSDPRSARLPVRSGTAADRTQDQLGIVGRAGELRILDNALQAAVTGGTGIVVVDGEPGVGKTHLLRELAARAAASAAPVVWGTCLEGDGAPSMWPWISMVEMILDSLPAEERPEWLAGELGRLVEPPKDEGLLYARADGAARFRLFEQVVALVDRAAARGVIMVVDDLQWADLASLRLFAHLAARLPAGALLVGALRDRAPTPGTELSQALAAASRAPGYHRIHLGPMTEAEVGELVRRQAGTEPGAGVVAGIHARTAGNPFFVRELSRLLVDTGSIAVASTGWSRVPATVRDVVLSRIVGLDEQVTQLLQLAALVGRDAGLDLLAHAAGIDVATCLERLEPLESLGVLGRTRTDPFSVRFPHDLVREAVIDVMGANQATVLHCRIADALESVTTDDDTVTERLAYHLWAAGPLADPARTAAALVRAGRWAAGKSAFESAEQQLWSAVRVARSAGLAELELSAVSPLAIVYWRQSGFSDSYTELLTRAEQVAYGLGQQVRAADFVFMRVVADFTQQHPEPGALLRRLADYGQASLDPTAAAYARHADAMYLWNKGKIGAALDRMNDDDWTAADDARWRQENPLRRDLRMFAPLFRGLLMIMAGDVEAARGLLKAVEDAAGDDPYAIAVWAHWAAFAAQWAGDPDWCLRITDRWRAADPQHLFVNVDSYLRVSRAWACGLTGDDPAAAAAKAERVIRAGMIDPPLFGVSYYSALLAELWLAADAPDRADAALDRADRFADAHNERFADCLRLLLRAQVLQARGERADVVRAAAADAVRVARERGAGMITRRAENLLTGLG